MHVHRNAAVTTTKPYHDIPRVQPQNLKEITKDAIRQMERKKMEQKGRRKRQQEQRNHAKRVRMQPPNQVIDHREQQQHRMQEAKSVLADFA